MSFGTVTKMKAQICMVEDCGAFADLDIATEVILLKGTMLT